METQASSKTGLMLASTLPLASGHSLCRALFPQQIKVSYEEWRAWQRKFYVTKDPCSEGKPWKGAWIFGVSNSCLQMWKIYVHCLKRHPFVRRRRRCGCTGCVRNRSSVSCSLGSNDSWRINTLSHTFQANFASIRLCVRNFSGEASVPGLRGGSGARGCDVDVCLLRQHEWKTGARALESMMRLWQEGNRAPLCLHSRLFIPCRCDFGSPKLSRTAVLEG